MSNTTNKGRKQGSPNRFTLQTKQQIAGIALPHLEKALKGINALEPIERINVLMKVLPYLLPKGSALTNQEAEVQTILEKHLMRHYERIGMYFSHLAQEKKAPLLVTLLRYITPKQITKVTSITKKQLKQP